MEFQKTINLPENTPDNKDLLKKGSIGKRIIGAITKKLGQKSQYFLSA